MPVEISEHVAAFFGEVLPVVVGTRRRSGAVRLNAAWFEYREDYFWLNSWRGAKWLESVERERAATLFLIDPGNMFRTAEVTTRLVQTTTEGAAEHIDRLSHRYQGGSYRSPTEQQRVIIQLDPVKLRTTIDVWAQMAAGRAGAGDAASPAGSRS